MLARHLLSFACYLGFDVTDLSEDGPDDVEGLDASAAHVANLLSTEPADSMFLRNMHNFCVSGHHVVAVNPWTSSLLRLCAAFTLNVV